MGPESGPAYPEPGTRENALLREEFAKIRSSPEFQRSVELAIRILEKPAAPMVAPQK